MEPFPIFDVSLIHAEAMSSTSSELNEKLLVNDHWNLKKKKKKKKKTARKSLVQYLEQVK